MLTFSHPGTRGQKGTQSRSRDPDPQHWNFLLRFPRHRNIPVVFQKKYKLGANFRPWYYQPDDLPLSHFSIPWHCVLALLLFLSNIY
jgi:hypothetical protein